MTIIPYVWSQSIYRPLLQSLQAAGVGPSGRPLFVFDYDWRFSNWDNARQLRKRIERQFGYEGKIDIVAHSMGGIIARLYIQEFGGSARVHTLVTLGTPHRGSILLFQRLKEGLEGWPSAWSGGLEAIQSTILSFPSVYELLPAYAECCAFGGKNIIGRASHGLEYVDIFDPATWARFDWLPAELRKDSGRKILSSYLSTARTIAKTMRRPIFPPENDTSSFVPIASASFSTWSRVFFDPDSGRILEAVKFPGDGTVLLYSASNANEISQPSFRKHAEVFVGEAPTETLRRALSGVAQHANESPQLEHHFRDGAGREIEIAMIEVAPELAMFEAGEAGQLTISFHGAARLQTADLSNITAAYGDDALLRKAGDIVEAFGQGIVRRLSFDFIAPNREGVFTLTVKVPDLDPINVVFLSRKRTSIQ